MTLSNSTFSNLQAKPVYGEWEADKGSMIGLAGFVAEETALADDEPEIELQLCIGDISESDSALLHTDDADELHRLLCATGKILKEHAELHQRITKSLLIEGDWDSDRNGASDD